MIMEDRIVNQYGQKPIYIEKNEGNIYIGNYIEDPSLAFNKGSYELLDYAPTIKPAIRRDEVDLIKDWISRKASVEKSSRLGLLYGKAGIGKSVVMHDLLEELQANKDYLVLGLKSDQVEFVDTEDLSRKIHLAQPIEEVIKMMAQKYHRVVLLIDQIDALSLSLSSNRTPLRSLLILISHIQLIPNVRVVISCRPYDLEYDPMLDDLRIKNRWELKEFSKEQVQKILNENNRNGRLWDNLLRFLGNPLHLYLFLKLASYELLTDPLSTDLLYHQLWRKYVLDDSVRKVEKTRLLQLLDTLVTIMYSRQELSVHFREFETEYSAELQYLFTNELLLITKSGKMQFFHQTLFDYIYARRFTEKGYNLLDVLKGQHQGLFSRAAVKSILTFLREKDPQEYVNTIEQLLYAKNEDGKGTYRYHLKSLALSNMGYFENPLKEELNLISEKLYYDKVYMNILFETIYTPNWFSAIWDIIGRKGGWSSLSKEYKDKTMLMCQRSLWIDGNKVLETVEKALDYNNEEDCIYIGNLLQYYNLNCGSEILIKFYNKLVKSRNPLGYFHLLKNILKDNPDFVCQELKENVRLQLLEKESPGLHRVNISHEVETLYEDMLKNHHDHAIQLLIEILTLIFESSQFLLDGAEIYNCMEYWGFQRVKGGHFATNFIEDAINIIIDDSLQHLDVEQTRQRIIEFSNSNHEWFVFIALNIFTERPDLFVDEAYDIITRRMVLENAPSWVEYQAVEALKANFGLMNDAQKTSVIDRVLAIDDKGEHTLYKDVIENRLQFGHPLLDIDLHKGKALKVIPIEELRRLSWKAYQERQRIDRKFNKYRLHNDLPSKTTMHSGWTSLREDQGAKMNCETWLKSMIKYNTDPHQWEKPSLTGQCHLFRLVVSKNPNKFIGLIRDTITDDRVQLDYPLAGMQGLFDAGRDEDALQVLHGLLGVVNNDVNSTKRGFSIHSVLFALNDIVKKPHVPEIVFDLLCNALINAKEPEDDRHQDERDVYNIGINQSRGNAGYMLVECAREEKYKEGIFSSIERIAESASVYTRGAILLNMAALNMLDKQRNVELFKKLLHDYDPRLMAMPVHNYNPLVYFINYAIDDLMDFFSHAADCPQCYKEQVIILWLAWSHNKRDERVKVFLDKMCDSNQEARISLLGFLGTLDQKMDEDAVIYILHFMECQFDSKEMGVAFDHFFHHNKSWPEGLLPRIAEAYVSSPVSKHQVRSFIEFLAGYAIKDPIQTLRWLEKILDCRLPSDDYYIWNHIVDVIIQSYNGIKSFNDSRYQDTLEHAMDLIDAIMQNPNNKYMITNFINKLDNE